MNPAQAVTVLAFAGAKEVLGFSERLVPLTNATTPRQLLESLVEDWQARLPTARVAIDLEYVSLDAPLHPGQTLAIIPPVSGG